MVTGRSIAAGFALGLAFAGTAGAQVTSDPGSRTTYKNCGGFTLTAGDTALVHAALDDVAEGRPAYATLQIIDESGTVKAQKKGVLLQPGQSTTLVMSVATPGASIFRAHVEFKEADLPVSARRATTSLVEATDLTAGTRTVCIPIDNGLRPPPQ
jgi:hypothetical protein